MVLPLTIGGLLYLAFRPTHLLLFAWAEHLGFAQIVASLRVLAAPHVGSMPPWVINSAPAGLWAFALTGGMSRLWRRNLQIRAWVWIGIAALVGIASELLQISGYLPGTFDPIDLLAYVVGSLLGVWAALSPNMIVNNRLENP